jgi:transcriptional antiterminator NusG
MYVQRPSDFLRVAAIIVDDHAERKQDAAIRERAILLSDLDRASRLIAEDSENAGWYCLKVSASCEKNVKETLEKSNVHVLLPMRKGKEKRHRGRILTHVMVPVMHGYVLVRVAPSIEAFRGLVNVDGVTEIIGGLEHPYRSSDREIMDFNRLAESGAYDYRRVEGKFDLTESVRVTDGPFSGFMAVVTNLDNFDAGRIGVNVDIFGRPTSVDMALAQI